MAPRRPQTVHPRTHGDLAAFLRRQEEDEKYGREIVHHEVIARRRASHAALEPPLPSELEAALGERGIERLYTHQAAALAAARAGRSVVTVTPTASGKTEAFLLPILETVLADESTRAILLFPLKALAQDQLKRIREYTSRPGLDHVRAAIYDGDTPRSAREKLRRDPPHLLLTNPDMLHHGLLPWHGQWEGLLRGLRFVVIDELHGYKGIFGSHVLQVLRRLRRVAHFYGASPTFLAASATIANPGELARELTGLPFDVVDRSGAPRAARHVLFTNPLTSPYTSAVRLLGEATRAGLKTIVFTKARRITELIHNWTVQAHPELAGSLSAYRSGYLPSERREIEAKLRTGELEGVIATSALEMGIDIGGLDVAILVGYPGTVAATWQRGGRVGRTDRDSAIFLLAMPDALDQYFMRHPADFFGRGVEAAVVDTANEHLLRGHLLCAAAELPLRPDDEVYDREAIAPVLRQLAAESELLEAAGGAVFFPRQKRPHREIDIRGGGEAISIFDRPTEQVVGQVNGWQALVEAHPGAIYLHHGQTFLVQRLDIEKREAWAARAEVNYYTQARTEKETEILEVHRTREEKRFRVSLGRLKVTERVTGYERRSTASREKISEHELDLPPVIYETIGIWFEISHQALAGLLEEELHPMGSLHAVEHASIALLPLFALCDRNDLGGISFTRHAETGGPTIFIYDGHPGGVGLAPRSYEVIDDLFERAGALVADCPCEEGCPSCIHSPKCGHGNQPLDKAGALRVFQHLTGGPELRGDPALAHSRYGTRGSAQTEPIEPRPSPPTEAELAVKAVEGGEAPGEAWADRRPLLEGRDVVVFDLETQLSAKEVGGWHNAHLMRIALGVTWERREERFRTWMEEDAPDLAARLARADLVVGFNQKGFDYAVLSIYTGLDLRGLPSLDLLEEIRLQHSIRLPLAALAAGTLGAGKTADGLQSLQWWKEGRVEEIERYCRMDVELTARLLEYALEHGHLLFTRDGAEEPIRLPLALDVERLLKPRD